MAEYILDVTTQTSKLDWAFPFQRTGAFPLDRSILFSSLADAKAYAKGDGSDARALGGTSYVGQIISVYDENEATAYIITAARGLMKLAATTSTGDFAADIADLQGKLDTLSATVEANKKSADEGIAALTAKQSATDGKVTAVEGRVDTLETTIAGLTGAMHFVGTSTTDPLSDNGATIEGKESFAAGDVCLYGKKEFVYDGAEWKELGDEGSYLTKESAAETYLTKNDAAATYATTENLAAELAKYTKTEDLTTQFAAKADATDVEALTTRVKDLEDAGAEANVVKSVSGEFAIDEAGKLSIEAIASTKVTGLTDALAGKVDKVDGQRLITTEEAAKLAKLTIDGDGDLTISGSVNADNVEGLGSWITTNRDEVAGLFSAANATKLNSIETEAEKNTIQAITFNGQAVAVDVDRIANITFTPEAQVVTSAAENQVAIGADKTMTVNSLNVNKLVQTDGDELILNGGNA